MTAKRTGNGSTPGDIGNDAGIQGLTRDRPWLLPSVSRHTQYMRTNTYR